MNQTTSITPLMHVKGYAAPETKAAAEQARLSIEEAEALGRQDLGRVAGRPGCLFLHVAGSRRATGDAGMSKRILVVEDQEDNRQIIRDMLSATDYEITEAGMASRRLRL